ncbi:MAG: cytidine deaminase [Woeseia sp.]|nr:cytidine deaminase [Woeseia sp.]
MSLSDVELIAAATEARNKAYAPYSTYYVGAALIDEKDKVHVGCNVENSSFPLGTCAEAGAISSMIASGGKKIKVIAAVGGRESLEACTPCGGCRQRINEFADADTRIVVLDEQGQLASYSMDEMLPESFRLERK